jgi:hypothetical protein
MSKTVVARPQSEEYAEYFSGYIGKVPGADVLVFLQQQLESIARDIRGIDPAKGDFRYENGKWSVKELLGHIIDTERVFSYRALVFARNDSSGLPGFDQDPWARHANYANLSFNDIADEFECVRRSTLALFRHLDAAAWDRMGVANNKKMTTRAAAYVIAGHTQHHMDILKARYLGK